MTEETLDTSMSTASAAETLVQMNSAIPVTEASEFEKLCLAHKLTPESIAKLSANSLSSVGLLELLRPEHLPQACRDWPLGQILALEAFIKKAAELGATEYQDNGLKASVTALGSAAG